MAKKSYSWFEKRHRTKALELAQKQIAEALDTANLLHKAIQSIFNVRKEEAIHQIERLFEEEREVDLLRTDIFKELSKGAAIFSESREDLMHVVKRLDTFADHVKDAGRCVKLLANSTIPNELWENLIHTTSTLVDCADSLRSSIEKIGVDSNAAIESATKVQKIENKIDAGYIKAKTLLIKHGEEMNSGAVVIFNDLVEFIEMAADMCADTADYIVVLSGE
jgi:predicted phosphate transport protein (TIGR00153 family)